MARPTTPAPGARLLEELRAFMPRGFQPGPRAPFTLDAGDGLAVTIMVTVERRATRDDANRYRNAALEHLATTRAGRRPRCFCFTKSRGFLKGGGGQCDARPVAVVVTKERDSDPPNFKFVCGRHQARHGTNPAYVVAVVEIPPASVEGAFQRGRARYEEQRRATMAAGAVPGDPSCRRCGTDRTCNYCDFTGVVTYTPPANVPGS